ncbi:nucleoside triphosphate pyrophosphohydrolase [Polymorphum gilvum]|uniref:Nucleoside triphosphate pyrophosphohydrolase n=1 Tax=Polymorphum gilvum (strain LMG 25793 / CGMCC 1.9160 / SL003B-26A1) TaxID=991905 RepID=F2J0N6_POLGS|nr:nucleoside triphosphate pyrophosphohydrolase [Polymorphum gilvum]ADZ70722.1 NTP pyrophosphohydrolase protein MazG [Polymorphum gilvum SL003B-26A1]
MKPGRDIQRLIDIMAALRTPGTGCPWDLEQDFSTIAPYTVEEAYEVADAIRRGDLDDLREELGDLLLQVVYHTRMAEEADKFAFADVVEAVTTKMIRRHPHVFGDEDARSAGMAKGMWDRIKAEEKAERKARRAALGLPDPEPGHLDAVPAVFPALVEAEKLQRLAARVGFDWGDARPVMAKIREELDELEVEILADGDTTPAMEDELGDVLFAVANLARHLGIDPEAALRRTNGKFRSRFAAIEAAARDRGTTLEAMTLDEMEAAWQAAKGK